MKIALFNSLYPPLGIGGSEMSVYYLAKGLVRAGHAVQVVTENTGPENLYEDQEGVAVSRLGNSIGFGPNIFDIPRVKRLQQRAGVAPPTFADRLAAAVPDFAPDVIHTNVIGGLRQIWQLGRSVGVPVVHTLRSYSMLCSRRMMRVEDGRVNPCARQCRDCASSGGRRRARDESSKIDAIVGISRHVLKVHREAGWFVDADISAVIANSYEAPLQDQPVEVVAPPRSFDLGYIGRLHPTKGVEVFLSAAVALSEARGGRILVAGTGNPEYVAALKAQFAGPNVVFAGHIEPSAFFEAVRFCVVPSVWYEPFGRIFIESLAHGVPVLASIRGGGGEVIDTETGFLFDPGSPEEITTAIIAALDLSGVGYTAMQRTCLERSKLYSIDRIAQSYLDIYTAVTASKLEEE